MGMKWLAWLLLASLLAVLAWLYRIPLGLASGPAVADLPGAAAVGRLLEPSAVPAKAPASPSPSGGVRKCVVKGAVLYTNGDCPAGSREQAVSGGTVNVLAAPNATTPAASVAQQPPNVRNLLVKPDEVNIKDKRMEEIIGK